MSLFSTLAKAGKWFGEKVNFSDFADKFALSGKNLQNAAQKQFSKTVQKAQEKKVYTEGPLASDNPLSGKSAETMTGTNTMIGNIGLPWWIFLIIGILVIGPFVWILIKIIR